MKKIISLLLTCIMLLSAVPLAAYADTGLGLDTLLGGMPFEDVKNGAWYYDAIAFCYLAGIVKGMDDTTFVPGGTLTRAQFVQILAMMDTADLDDYKNKKSGFEDVKKGHWYNAAVCWAVKEGYVKGVSDTRFAPNDPITREQLARLLYLYAEAMELDVKRYNDLSAYKDKKDVSKWAYSQVQWAVEAGIISGTSADTLSHSRSVQG